MANTPLTQTPAYDPNNPTGQPTIPATATVNTGGAVVPGISAQTQATGVGGVGQSFSAAQSKTYPAAPANPGGYGSANSNNPSPYGYDANGNPYGGPTSSNPNPSAANYTTGANVPAPQSEDEIKAQMTKDAQSQIDAINQNFASIIANDTATNAQNYGAGRGALAARGLLGSADAASSEAGATAAGNRVIAADQSAQATQIAGVYSAIDANALTQANNERDAAVTDSETYLANQQKIAASAQAQVGALAKLGVTSSTVQSNDPALWDSLKSQSGYSDYQLQVSLDNDPSNPNAKQTTQTYAADPSNPNSTIVRRINIDPTTGKSTETDYSIPIPYNQADPKAFQVLNGTLYYKDPATGNLIPQIPEPYKTAASGAQVYSTDASASLRIPHLSML